MDKINKSNSSRTLAQNTSLFLIALASSSAVEASTCTAGFYDPLGGSACVASDPGSYVPVDGADVQTQADPGSYVPTSGATSQIQADPGNFVPNSGASAQILATPGFFVSTSGATAAEEAPAGFFVPNSGATSANQATAGTYVPNSGASAALDADPGSYVPTNGATSQIQADPGNYVPNSGASSQTEATPGFFVSTSGATTAEAAPAGFYVPNAGATTAIPAPAGSYVPNSGASAPSLASNGFYTAAPSGATAQIPAGGMSAPLTGALQSSALFNSMATDLLDDTNQAILKVSTAYQHSSLEQDGLSSGELDTDIGAVTFQLNLIEEASKKTGLQVSYGHYSADNSSEVASSGDSYEIAAFQTGNIFDKGRYQAFLVYGQTDYDNTRNVIINAAGTNRETLKSEGDISWYGVRSEISYPIQENINLIGQIGLLEYSADSVQETGVATLNGTPTASIAALRADDADFISVPFKFAVGYDLAFDKEAEKHSAFTLETGVIGNLNNTEDLRLTSTNTGNSFDLSVNQSSTVAGLVALKLNEFEIGEGFNLSGITQVEMGSDITTLRAGINITKRW